MDGATSTERVRKSAARALGAGLALFSALAALEEVLENEAANHAALHRDLENERAKRSAAVREKKQNSASNLCSC